VAVEIVDGDVSHSGARHVERGILGVHVHRRARDIQPLTE